MIHISTPKKTKEQRSEIAISKILVLLYNIFTCRNNGNRSRKFSWTTGSILTRKYSDTLSGSSPENSTRNCLCTSLKTDFAVKSPTTRGVLGATMPATALPTCVSPSIATVFSNVLSFRQASKGITLPSILFSHPVPSATRASTTDFTP